jgi:peptidyl-tRNA hydrolase, PTH1 family
MKVVCGLGNPGAEYEATRHNVGWWLLEAAHRAWSFGAWTRQGIVRYVRGSVAGRDVALLAPLTYMNRSGAAITPLLGIEGFEAERDLLVVVDDVALDVGRVRFRARGSAGGHNGLKSVEGALRSQEYARLRIGVGAAPPDADLAEWVLSPFEPEDEQRVREALVDALEGVRAWIESGAEAAIRHNR